MADIENLLEMAPVATSRHPDIETIKQEAAAQLINPFYSPAIGDDGDDTYPYDEFKVSVTLTRHTWDRHENISTA